LIHFKKNIYPKENLISTLCHAEKTRWQEGHQMEESVIYERLTQVFSDIFDEESIKLNSTLSAKDVDGWDSLTHIRLILTIEKTFKIKFSTSEIGKLENVGDLVSLIRARA
jgi:acyl carrier protein